MSIYDLPAELVISPHEYIALSGLNIANNVGHKVIWDAFVTNRRADRLPLHFKILSNANEFPKPKAKQPSSVESIAPRGIIKRNWAAKHMFSIPAVVALFIDLDWNDVHFAEKKVECVSKVEYIRHSLEGRSTRIAVVLIQQSAPLPHGKKDLINIPYKRLGEDTLAAERVTELCSACDLTPKSLFVLPHTTSHLYGYILRLEHAFYELAQNYYLSEIRRVKSKREYFNKPGHQPLLMRYQFKLGLLNELKQDTHAALKHYKQAYAHATELVVAPQHLAELKAVSGFLSYKICKLCFHHNTPLDAIGQFRRHVDHYKDSIGQAELAFEHYEWLSKQFSAFGDLFDAAIQEKLAAVQTQHPGFYFQSAANQVFIQRQVALRICKATTAAIWTASEEQPASLEVLNSSLEFYGQRFWRTQYLTPFLATGAETFDMMTEQRGILTMQWHAYRCDYSTVLVPLLTSAMNNFKKYRCPRMKRFVMVQLAQEYYTIGDHAKASQLLSHSIWEYRSERWLSPLKLALELSYKCAYATAAVKDYITTSLELLSPALAIAQEQRVEIQSNLFRVLSGTKTLKMPLDTSSDLCPSTNISPDDLWDKELVEKCFALIAMRNILGCVECRPVFVTEKCSVDDQIHLQVVVRSDLPLAVQFSKLSISFTNETYNSHCLRTSSDCDLSFMPGEIKIFDFQFWPCADDAGASIEVASVSLDIGQLHSNVYLSLCWEGWSAGCAIFPFLPPVEFLVCSKSFRSERNNNSRALAIPRISLLQREPLACLLFEHTPPALLNETYPVTVTIENKESSAISDVQIDILPGLQCIIAQDATGTLSQSQLYDVSADSIQKDLTLTPLSGFQQIFPDLEAGGKITFTFFTKQFQVGEVQLKVQLYYSVKPNTQSKPCICTKSELLTLSTIIPFTVQTTVSSLKMEQVERFVLDEPCLVLADIQCTSPWPIEIQTTKWLILGHLEEQPSPKVASTLTNVKLCDGDVCTICCYVTPRLIPTQATPIGTLEVLLNRFGAADNQTVASVVTLPVVPVEWCPVNVSVRFPAYGVVRNVLTVEYEIFNHAETVIELNTSMELAEAFMFAGHKQLQVRILPKDSTLLKFTLFPLIAGEVLLPRLKLTSTAYAQELLDLYAQRNVPSSIFILPCAKTASPRIEEPKFNDVVDTVEKSGGVA